MSLMAVIIGSEPAAWSKPSLINTNGTRSPRAIAGAIVSASETPTASHNSKSPCHSADVCPHVDDDRNKDRGCCDCIESLLERFDNRTGYHAFSESQQQERNADQREMKESSLDQTAAGFQSLIRFSIVVFGSALISAPAGTTPSSLRVSPVTGVFSCKGP